MARWLTGFVLLSGLLALALLSSESVVKIEPNDSLNVAKTEQQSSVSMSLPQIAIKPLEQHQGQFVLDKGTKDVLESLILHADSTDIQKILQVGKQYCEAQQLTQSSCNEFIHLLSTYLNYKLTLTELAPAQEMHKPDISALKNQLQALESLRRAFFSNTEYENLFAHEQRHDEQAMARREIALASELTKQQKQQLIQENLRNLPDEQRKALQPTLDMQTLASLKTQYSDNQARLSEVENHFGIEAAKRLANTWQEQSEFSDKVKHLADDYHRLNDESQKQALLSQVFSGNELRRAKVLLTYGEL